MNTRTKNLIALLALLAIIALGAALERSFSTEWVELYPRGVSIGDRISVETLLKDAGLSVKSHKSRFLVAKEQSLEARTLLFGQGLPKNPAVRTISENQYREFPREVSFSLVIDEIEQMVETLPQVEGATLQVGPIGPFKRTDVKVLLTVKSDDNVSEATRQRIKNLLLIHEIPTKTLEFEHKTQR